MKTQTQFKNASLVSVVNGSIVVKDSAGKEHTFTNASVVSVNNGTIIIKSEWKPKRGELVKVTNTCIDAYCIIDKIGNGQLFVFGWKKIDFDQHCLKSDFWLTNSQTKISPVTPEEIQELDDQLAAEGKCWNPDTMQVEKLRWKPVTGQAYYYVALEVRPYISYHIWRNDNIDNEHYRSKNCFKTEEEAKVIMEKIEKVLLEN